ncbi:MAG: PP2C family protein-serine/threonine phosphatase [Micromonosporaceae bacterium]
MINSRIKVGELAVRVAADTDIGLRYQANFDTLYVDPDQMLIVIADGMGGGEGSAVASRTAVEVFAEEVGSAVPGPTSLRAAVGEAQRRVRAEGERLGELTGCTLTALVGGDAGDAWIVQVGDSRAHRLRNGLLELLTVDHTEAWLAAVYGWYPSGSPQAAAARYRLTRYVGHPEQPEPDILNVALRPGDTYCVCSDGLADHITYQRLREAMGLPPEEAVPALLTVAEQAGGLDNATVAVLTVEAG